MLGVTRINHTAFRIDDKAQEVEDFYRNVVGVPVVERELPEQLKQVIPGFWLQLGEVQTHFIQAAPKDAPRNPMGSHLALYVADLAQAVAALSTAGIQYDQFDRFVFFSDPAGTTIELQQDPNS